MSTLLYNPDRKNKKQFLEEFVIRTEVFDEIFRDIKSGKMLHPEQHYLLVGQRGAGKTTLLNRLKYAVDDDQKLNQWLIPVLFNEEQYHISELANVWENIATYLEDYHGFDGICEEIESQLSRGDFEDKALTILLKRLDEQKKKVILFIDNIGDLLNKFDKLEIHRLREVLQTKGQIRIIAGSTLALESLTDYQQPLFEFFKVIRLEGLSYDESVKLLLKLADVYNEREKIETIIKNSPSRIETLRVLSGGVPRTIALLFQVFVDNEHGTALSDLEKVLDSVTPLYKHRMDDLPAQQQKIVDAVAKNWDPVSVKKLVTSTRLESKVISAQLKQLERNQVIEILSTGKKNHAYMLKERFYNIWYLMRYGRKHDRNRVIWLVKFLEMWCNELEIEERINNYVEKHRKNELSELNSEIFGEVYTYFSKIKPALKLQLKNVLPDYLDKHVIISDAEYRESLSVFIANNEWDKIITIFSKKERLNDDEQRLIFDAINKMDGNILKHVAGLLSEKLDVDSNIYYESFFVNVLLYIQYRALTYVMLGSNVDLDDLNDLYGDFVNDLSGIIKDEGLSETLRYVIGITLFILIGEKYYSLADKLFSTQIGEISLSEEFKVFKIARLILEHGDVESVNTVAPEILNSSLRMVAEIKMLREADKRI